MGTLNQFCLEWTEPRRVTDITFGLSGVDSMQKHGWVIRVRMDGNVKRMEYKAPLDQEWNEWEEVGMEVSDIYSGIKILQKIGLKSGLLIDRFRKQAHWRSLKLVWDNISLLGEFLEIDYSSDQNLDDLNSFLNEFKNVTLQEVAPYGLIILNRMDADTSFAYKINKHFQNFIENLKECHI